MVCHGLAFWAGPWALSHGPIDPECAGTLLTLDIRPSGRCYVAISMLYTCIVTQNKSHFKAWASAGHDHRPRTKGIQKGLNRYWKWNAGNML